MAKEMKVHNYHELKKEIIYRYGSLKKFAIKELNITPTYFSRILSSKAEYSQKLMEITIQALNLDSSKVGSYFFTYEFRKVA